MSERARIKDIRYEVPKQESDRGGMSCVALRWTEGSDSPFRVVRKRDGVCEEQRCQSVSSFCNADDCEDPWRKATASEYYGLLGTPTPTTKKPPAFTDAMPVRTFADGTVLDGSRINGGSRQSEEDILADLIEARDSRNAKIRVKRSLLRRHDAYLKAHGKGGAS